jgi:hypothetical protein
MQLPFNRALLWLFVEGRTDQEIADQLDELSLPQLEHADFEGLRLQSAELPFSPGMRKRLLKKQFDKLDLIIAERVNLAEIYCRHTGNFVTYPRVQLAWEEVERILKNPVLRIAIDVGILCKYSLEEISQILPSAYHEQLSEEGMGLYTKYFFDYKAMSKADWRIYLRLWATIPYGYIRYHAALTKPREEALFLAGLPTKADFAGFLKTVMGTAAYKFQHYARMGTPQSDSQARSWAKVGFDAGVRYDKFSSTDATDFSKTVQTAFDYVDTDIPTITTDLLSEIKPPDQIELKDTTAPDLRPPNQRETEV